VRRAREAGFTLLEALAALAVLALLGMGMAALLEGATAARVGASRAVARATVEDALRIPETRLARALPVPRPDGGRALRGTPARLDLVFAPLPERVEEGLRVGRLALHRRGEETLLRWCEGSMPPRGDPLAALADAPCTDLARLPGAARLAYLVDGADGRPRWRDRVGPADPWPRAVRLAWAGALPRLWPLRIRALAACAGGGCP